MRRLSRWIPILGGAIAGAVIALVIVSTSGTSHSVTTVVAPSSATSEPTAFKSSGGMTINQIYRAASPGVVDIHVISQSQAPSLGLFGGGGGKQQSEGEGAGVVYDTKGNILTDEHVVANATSVRVTFQDGKTVPAKVVGTDSSTDVGVIHVDVPASELHPIPLADSSKAQVGDPVVAIGSPFGLPETVTAGIVSQTGRPIPAPNHYQITGAIQTDAAINPGNSGGPLLDANARVLGLNDQIETSNTTVGGEGSNSGVGFATPINTDAKVANLLIAGQKVKHAWVGVSLASTGSGGAQIALNPSPGCSQPPVAPNSPASSAGLQPGDLITAVDGKAVTSTDQFIEMVDNYKPGQKVTLTIKRQGQSKQVPLTLGVRPAQPSC
ncbi:MAG: S1C family serine protease [Solirubrobacteraceae bacterium]